MAKKKMRSPGDKRQTRKTRQTAAAALAIPAGIDPTSALTQPDWIQRQFPHYVHAHGGPVSSTREFYTAGHHVKITTTYVIEVDGAPIYLHAAVGDDGKLMCHSAPYSRFQSAVEMVKAVIENNPEAFHTGVPVKSVQRAQHHEHAPVTRKRGGK